MAIDSDTNQGGASRRAISRTHENDRTLLFILILRKKKKDKK